MLLVVEKPLNEFGGAWPRPSSGARNGWESLETQRDILLGENKLTFSYENEMNANVEDKPSPCAGKDVRAEGHTNLWFHGEIQVDLQLVWEQQRSQIHPLSAQCREIHLRSEKSSSKIYLPSSGSFVWGWGWIIISLFSEKNEWITFGSKGWGAHKDWNLAWTKVNLGPVG